MVTQPGKRQPPKGDVLRAKQDNSLHWRTGKMDQKPQVAFGGKCVAPLALWCKQSPYSGIWMEPPACTHKPR